MVWHSCKKSHYPRTYSSFANTLLWHSSLYLPPLKEKWWLKASHLSSSILQTISLVIHLLQHTSIWSSYSTPPYFNYYACHYFPCPVTPKSSRFHSHLNAATQTRGNPVLDTEFSSFYIHKLEAARKETLMTEHHHRIYKYTNIAEEKSIFKPTHSELHYCYSAQELPLSLNLSMLPKEDFYNVFFLKAVQNAYFGMFNLI